MAGELAFITATTNNQSVQVDFASWVLDAQNRGHVLANVEASNKPTHAESAYAALENSDGTVQIAIFAGMRMGSNAALFGITNSYEELEQAYLNGTNVRPRRCGGTLFLNARAGVPIIPGKCDAGLDWGPGSADSGSRDDFLWTKVSGTTEPMRQYMLMDSPTDTRRIFRRGFGSGRTMKTVLSETYVHLWERSFD